MVGHLCAKSKPPKAKASENQSFACAAQENPQSP
jgi:hypothetical protein